MLSNDKFRITYLGKELYTSKGDLTDYLNRIPNDKFTRTKVAITDNNGTKSVEDLTIRSSWTYNDKINVYNEEIIELSDDELEFTLLKYEKDDFFKLHKDHKGSHTCLILGGTQFQGGVLTIKNNIFEIKINPEDIKDGYYMIIFSINFLHEVTPIIDGVRYVLKSSFYTKSKDDKIPGEIIEYEIEDGCYEDSPVEEHKKPLINIFKEDENENDDY